MSLSKLCLIFTLLPLSSLSRAEIHLPDVTISLVNSTNCDNHYPFDFRVPDDPTTYFTTIFSGCSRSPTKALIVDTSAFRYGNTSFDGDVTLTYRQSLNPDEMETGEKLILATNNTIILLPDRLRLTDSNDTLRLVTAHEHHEAHYDKTIIPLQSNCSQENQEQLVWEVDDSALWNIIKDSYCPTLSRADGALDRPRCTRHFLDHVPFWGGRTLYFTDITIFPSRCQITNWRTAANLTARLLQSESGSLKAISNILSKLLRADRNTAEIKSSIAFARDLTDDSKVLTQFDKLDRIVDDAATDSTDLLTEVNAYKTQLKADFMSNIREAQTLLDTLRHFSGDVEKYQSGLLPDFKSCQDTLLEGTKSLASQIVTL